MVSRWALATAAVAILAVSASAATAADPAEASIDFGRDVLPILAKNCFLCHGPDESDREADLRLDNFADATAARGTRPAAIVPGKPDESELIGRIESADDEKRMPPADSKKKLTPEQKQTLRRWIASGAEYRPHWAYAPLNRPEPPTVANAAWPRNDIDRFVLHKLEERQLAPAKPAAAEALLRRMSFDLIGLPPTPEEVEAIRGDSSATAWQVVIDRLLSSPHYGEQWARHWMDVVRYGDSAGYEMDQLLASAWQYRDWMIRSFNANKPLDRFIQEQIAGDQLWPDSEDAVQGSLFLSVGPRRSEGGIKRDKQRFQEWLTDAVDTTGSALLGSTLGCARCHDHKFDAFTQRDYYSLQAIFADSKIGEIAPGNATDQSRPLKLAAITQPMPEAVQLLFRGEISAPRDTVPAELPTSLSGQRSTSTAGDKPLGRADLARWLTGDGKSLVARVLVNRVWQWHFGKGLVRTPNDFGVQGERPTHPALLEYLACELVDHNWDLQYLQRLILNSATYRMSSQADPQVIALDPEHRLLTRFPRRRLQAEELRDALLACAGELNEKQFGVPVVTPTQAWELASLRNQNWIVTADVEQHRRRTVYLIVRRSVRPAMLEAFNVPDTISSCPLRDSTVVSTQALLLLNSETSLEHARGLAGRLWNESQGDTTAAARRAWLILFGRAASADEVSHAVDFLTAREANWQTQQPGDAAQPRGVTGTAPEKPRGAAWVEWCLALLNANEFIYID